MRRVLVRLVSKSSNARERASRPDSIECRLDCRRYSRRSRKSRNWPVLPKLRRCRLPNFCASARWEWKIGLKVCVRSLNQIEWRPAKVVSFIGLVWRQWLVSVLASEPRADIVDPPVLRVELPFIVRRLHRCKECSPVRVFPT
jgi:hypothetical protein